jgi:hypothetical protein
MKPDPVKAIVAAESVINVVGKDSNSGRLGVLALIKIQIVVHCRNQKWIYPYWSKKQSIEFRKHESIRNSMQKTGRRDVATAKRNIAKV